MDIDPSVIEALEKIRDWAQDMMVSDPEHKGDELPQEAAPPDAAPPEDEPAELPGDELPPEDEEVPRATTLGSFRFGGGSGRPNLPRTDGKQPVGKRRY